MHIKHFLAAAACVSLTLTLATQAKADLWFAQPLVVHEWGVHEFDYGAGIPAPAEIPPFMYTDTRPGIALPPMEKRAKDYPPDSGIRKKPILYFYPNTPTSTSPIPLGVELRFSQGHANAWYPQVNTYRTPAMTAGAKEPDWEAWKKANSRMGLSTTQPLPAVPDDPRMELVWSRLNLSTDLPAGATLAQVPAGDWVDAARQVKSGFISNGKETEKFLFYEGATHESPSIAVLPDGDGMYSGMGHNLHIVNVAETPIYNVFAIYHHDKRTWIGYNSVLEPLKSPASSGGSGNTIQSITLPDFEKNNDWIQDKDLPRLTTERLLSALTEGDSLSINHSLRDPADPQGATSSSQLYPDEAAALEKIWHDDMFKADGLTIVYRESPAALDKAMPLNLYTDMYHYIVLSRCGMVICKNVTTAAAADVFTGVLYFEQAPGGQWLVGIDDKRRQETLATLKANRMLTLGAIAYYKRTGHDPKGFAQMEASLDQK